MICYARFHVIDFLEIGHLLDRHLHLRSRGENQRVVVARALLSAPQLLLLDEPLAALDAKLKNVILQQLQALHREFGIPMLFVTHDPVEAIAICEEVLLLQAGRITAKVIRQNFSAEPDSQFGPCSGMTGSPAKCSPVNLLFSPPTPLL